MPNLISGDELMNLVHRVFSPGSDDKAMAILVDLPRTEAEDKPDWSARRALAFEWARLLAERSDELGMRVSLVSYPATGSNNGDLPEVVRWEESLGSRTSVGEGNEVPLKEVLARHTILMAVTQFSATAPLKLLAPRFGFRAATMPGFSPEMVPALRIDYGEVNRRVELLKTRLDEAESAEFHFRVTESGRDFRLNLDLRYRHAHASGGLLPRPGTAGNLPSGEAYIVPYEGELPGDASRSEGMLPVDFNGEVVVYRIHRNCAVEVEGIGSAADRERDLLTREPAYGNIAELGLGVLDDFGIRPCGSILLDEKLGLHIAFGRSDHFGGQVGASRFSSPAAVVHIDRVYIPAVQPKVEVVSVDLLNPGGRSEPLMRDGKYLLDWGETDHKVAQASSL